MNGAARVQVTENFKSLSIFALLDAHTANATEKARKAHLKVPAQQSKTGSDSQIAIQSPILFNLSQSINAIRVNCAFS
jgi:hypothetical protein